MTSRDQNWMAAVLGVNAPWQISDVKLAPNSGIVTLVVEREESGSRFWPGRKPAPVARRLRWDHVALGGRRCEVVLALREGQSVPEAPWTGEADMPFTRGLSRLVLDLMLEGATMAQLCRMLELPFSDLWKYKFRLDQGSTRAPEPRDGGARRSTPPVGVPASPLSSAPQGLPLGNPVITSTPATATPAAPQPLLSTPAAAVFTAAPPSASPAAGLPPEDAPVWMALLKGRLTLDVQALSLKLLLSKMLREAKSHTDADLHQQAAQSLHRYFLRNQSLLGPEIAQLAAAAAAQADSPAVADKTGVPDVSDPLWLSLLLGERDLDVRALSLRLLLSKLRVQARVVKDDEMRMLKLVELHRFFEKNQAVLRHEISQLQHWSVH